MTFTAHFHRWASKPTTEDFPTLDEAVTFLAYGVDGDYLAAEKITGSDGFVLTGQELRDAMWEVLDRHEKSSK